MIKREKSYFMNGQEAVCKQCSGQQWSLTDKKYLAMFGHCWSCDKKNWENKTLSLEEFEKREKLAVTC